MLSTRQICLVLVLVCVLCSTAAAQDSTSAKTTLTITANATGERVRITAPSSVVQMHVEVYAASGEKLFDQEIRGGNVFDWHLQDGQAQRLAPGAYVCVVTAKSVSGKITQKLGTVTVAEKSASVQPGAQQLSLQQTQAIGPVEADSSWTIAGENELQTPTVIANDGTDGQMIRGRGALTFRVGNFFSGVDQEQMRLTEAGDLGIGTLQPQSKLDVAGTIRAERFLVVKPNLGNVDKTAAATQATDAVDGVQPLVAGTGTQNQIAKWTDNAGTLGDSVITETPAGKVGVGIAVPLSKFHVSSSFDALRLTSTNDTTPVWAQFNTSLGTGLGYFGVEGNTPGTFLAGTLPYATALSSGGSGTALQLGSAGSVRMTILSGGNVGIGAPSPATPLEVNGVLRSTRSGVVGQYLQLHGGDPASIRLTAQSLPLAEKSLVIQNLSGEATTPGVSNTIQFQLGTTAAPSTKMIIDKNGVLIGTSDSNSHTKLFVVAADGSDQAAVAANSENGSSFSGFSNSGPAVVGATSTGRGVYGSSNFNAGYAGYFDGNVFVNGTINKAAVGFKIDHPLDPANKYLYHTGVESPDMLNLYNGNLMTDENGEATVTLPEWFEALNRDFRYQLTVIGEFAQAMVATKIKNNQFTIKTDKPRIEVSWQVTGIRKDAYANSHRMPIEEQKAEKDRGYYLRPELFGQPEEKGVEWAQRPEQMRQMKEQREKALQQRLQQ